MSNLPKSTQVLVVGAGPAGCCAATILAREGFDVTIVEKSSGSNYKVGESLLPTALEIFDLMGVRDKVESHGFIPKIGAYFEWGNQKWDMDFQKVTVNNSSYAFQVRRAEFDRLLLEHAKSQGVKVFQGIEIRQLSFDGDHPQSATWSEGPTSNNSGEIAFDYIVDASGRYGLIANKYLKTRQFHKQFENLAIWGYWQNADIAKIHPKNATVTASTKDGSGWFWAIPVDEDLLSVGLVINKDIYKKRRTKVSMEQVLLDAIADCPYVADLIAPGELTSPVKIDRDFSYSAEKFSGPGYFLVGDAACFLDPLISTGVHLAFFTGMLAAASLKSILRNEVPEEQASNFYHKTCQFHYLSLLIFVAGFYHKMHENKHIPIKAESQSMSRDFIKNIKDLKKIEPDMRDMVAKHMASLFSKEKEATQLMIEQQMKGDVGKDSLKKDHEKIFGQIFNELFSNLPDLEGLRLTKKPQFGLVRVNESITPVPMVIA